MKKTILGSVLALTVLASLPAHADTRTDIQPYLGGPGDAVVLECNGTDNLGGACFALEGDEVSATVAVKDVTGLPVGAYYQWTDALSLTDGNDLGSGSFCASSPVLPKPEGAVMLVVFIDELLGPLDCLPQGVGAGTTGEVHTTFELAAVA